MADPVLPNVIAGPAIVTHDSYSFYTESGIVLTPERESFDVNEDSAGKIDTRHKALLNMIEFTPVGEVESLAKYFPYGVGSVGKSIFGTSNLPLVIVTKFGGAANTGQTRTFPRGAIFKPPQLRLGSQQTLFGSMQMCAIGSASVQDNNAAFWSTLADAVFANTDFDETKVVTDIYTAAFGSSPYNSMGSKAGFIIDLEHEMQKIYDDGRGLVDIHLTSLSAKASFSPNNLTEAQYDTLLGYQNTDVIRPGQSYSKGNTDLVIAGSGNNGLTLTATLSRVGPRAAKYAYKSGEHRLGDVEFVGKRRWSTGTAVEPLTLAIT